MVMEEALPLGLKLNKTPSFLDLVSAITHSNKSSSPRIKASNFAASSIQIGNWQRISRYEEDIVAKCYYAKRKFVWEVMEEDQMKRRMEIHWADVTSLHAQFNEHGPETLIVEVSKPPVFCVEHDPEPRKHTQWRSCADFSSGEATVCSQHVLQFPCGVLHKHFEKLVNHDERLKSISQISSYCQFPSLDTTLVTIDEASEMTSEMNALSRISEFLLEESSQETTMEQDLTWFGDVQDLLSSTSSTTAADSARIQRSCSAENLLVNLPRVASLPQFFSEDRFGNA